MAVGNGKPFGDGNWYDNKKKATKKQRDEIINTIIHNKYDTVGTDIIKIGNSIFLFDHTDRDDLYKSYWNTKKGEIPDGTGYGIRKKYNFAEITKEDLHEIITNIAASYNSDEASIRNWLQELGIKPRNLSGIDFAAAIREGNRDNGLGISQSRGGGNQTVEDTGDAISRENKGKEQFFITPQGEVYGFVDKDGNIQHEIIMKLTEEQKKITPSQKFWEMQEKGKKQVELWQQQPMTLEEVNQMMAERKAFIKKHT